MQIRPSGPVFSVLRSFLFLGMTALFLSSCDLAENQLKIDRAAHMEFQDFRDGLSPRLPESTEETAEGQANSGIPDFQSYIANPSENLRPMPLVSISVNQTIPLRDVLFELAEQAEYDIELDPRIRGAIIFTAREKPFDTVVRRISDIAGLRYKFEEDTLRVELDTPYHETYKIDYLSYVRTNNGAIRNDVAVVSGGGEGSANTGSQFEAASKSEADFWGELETNLAQMLEGANTRALRTQNDPQITAVDQNPAPVEPVVTAGEEGAPEVQVQAPEATLQVNSLPTDPLDATGEEEVVSSVFSVNRQAGLISIFATERQHDKVATYLKHLRRSVTAQVLIEAKILEVALSDEFATGIDWTAAKEVLSGDLSFGLDVTGNIRPALDPVVNPTSDFFVAYTGNDITGAIEAISRFGTVRALSSPRLTVLNNQSAVLNVANNQVYFEIDIDVTTQDNVTQTDIDSDIRNVPEGVLINVQPSIDLDSRTVSMAVRPTVTRIIDFVDDPSVQFVTAQNNIQGVQSRVPVVNVQEIDSVVSMGSGQTVIMGGLMQDRTDSTQTGVPVLSEMPILGGLFRAQSDKVEKTELVIFLKSTIIGKQGNGTIHDTDRDVYKMFSGDRRPVDL